MKNGENRKEESICPLARRAWAQTIAVIVLNAVNAIDAFSAPTCTHDGIEIQVLGSGGPELQTKRASSSYLIWRDRKAVVLVDSGGGSALRFGESGAQMTDLAVILLTHLHIDHTADFAALIKSSYFEERGRPLPVYGPGGGARFPSTTAFAAALFGRAKGAYRYLGNFVTGNESGYQLLAHDVILDSHDITRVFSADGLVVSASPVLHGDVPALAWRVEIEGRVIVFSGDTNGLNGNLERLAHNADIFIAHSAVPEGATGELLALHMRPSLIGKIAAAAAVKKLVLSHRMLRTLGREQETRTAISRTYSGPVAFADDLDCYQ